MLGITVTIEPSRAYKKFFLKKNVTLPLALCLSEFARWHYGGISGIFARFLIIFMRKNKLKGKIFVRFLFQIYAKWLMGGLISADALHR